MVLMLDFDVLYRSISLGAEFSVWYGWVNSEYLYGGDGVVTVAQFEIGVRVKPLMPRFVCCFR